MDLEHPLRHVEYEELRPLLVRVHEQNRQIAGQIQELKERHEEYLAITENMKDGLVVASQTEVLSINKAAQELFQVQASDCIRKPISRVSRNKELKKRWTAHWQANISRQCWRHTDVFISFLPIR